MGSECAGANPATHFGGCGLAAGRRINVAALLVAALSCSECRWDYTASNGEVAGSNPVEPTLRACSSEVRAPCPTTLVAALAVEAQIAGPLVGIEEMEGAIPSDGSSILAAMVQ